METGLSVRFGSPQEKNVLFLYIKLNYHSLLFVPNGTAMSYLEEKKTTIKKYHIY